VLAGGLVVLASGGAGVAGAVLPDRSPEPRPEPPGVLVAAAAAERALLADLTATTGGTAEVRVLLAQAAADHRAHLAALTGLLAAYRSMAPAAARGTPRTRAQLRSAERAASTAAARRAERLTGPTAALLASIAACEASHAELLG
jgi:hypothetical protein